MDLDRGRLMGARFTRFDVDTDTSDYGVTVINPIVWMGPMEGTLFEYACHKESHSVPNVLGGKRDEESAETTR